jgi:MFS family permease
MRDRPEGEERALYLAGQSSTATKSTLTVRQVFSRRNFWVTVAVFVPIQCASISMTVNLAPIVTSYGFTPKVAGLMIAVLSISALAAKLVAGFAADRFGNRVPMIVVALLCAGGLGGLVNSSGNLLLLVASFMMIGLSGGVWTLLASATAAEFGREGFGRAFGLICMFPPVASLAPPMVARIKEINGNYTIGLSILCGLALLGAGVACLLRETRTSKPVPTVT